jgi:hypothetical protein
VRTREAATATIALVRGFVFDLAWHAPGMAPRLLLLVCRGQELIAVSFDDDMRARRAFEDRVDSLLDKGEVVLTLPLRDGQLFGQDPVRDDELYGWAVETADTTPPCQYRARPGVGRPFV